MAKFNPDVPDIRAPDYLRESRSITQPEGNRAAAYAGQAAAYGMLAGSNAPALETIASSVSLAAKGAGDVFESMIKNDARNELEPVKNEMLTNLAQAASQPQAPATSTVANQTLAASGDSDAPGEVKAGIKDIGVLANARANGKISPTQYYARLNNIASALKARYSGFADLVDQEVQKITGVDPANAYMRSLIADINAASAAAKEKQDSIEKLAMSERGLKTEGMPRLLTNYQAGLDPGGKKIIEAVAAREAEDARYARISAQNNAAEGTDKALSKRYEEQATVFAAQEASKVASNIGAGDLTLDQIRTIHQERSAGKLPNMTDEQMIAVGQQVDSYIEQAKASIEREGLKIQDPVTGRTIVGMVGRKRFEEIKNDSVAGMLELKKNIMDRDTGSAYINARLAKTIEGDTAFIGLKHDSMNRLMQFYRGTVGESAMPYIIQNWLPSGMDESIKKLNTKLSAQMATQTTDGTTKKVVTLNNAVDEASSKLEAQGVEDKQTKADTYNWLLKTVEQIGITGAKAPSDVAKFNWAEALVKSPGITNRFPNNEKIVVFQRLTSDPIIKEIGRLSEAQPKLKRAYVGWSGNEFGIMFIQDVSSIKDIPSQVSYIKPDQGAPSISVVSTSSNVRQTVARINLGLERLHAVGQRLGMSDAAVQASLVNLLNHMGYTSNVKTAQERQGEMQQSVKGFGQGLIDAIASYGGKKYAPKPAAGGSEE